METSRPSSTVAIFNTRFIAFLLLPAALFVISTGCKEKIQPGAADMKRPAVEGVTVTEVSPSKVSEAYETSGTVRAVSVSNVSGRMMGTVTSIHVKEGDFVRSGQVLMTIDDSDVSQKVKAAEAGHNEALKALEAAKQGRALAEITYQRYKKLNDEKAVSQQEMDQIETRKNIADIEYGRVQEMVNRAVAGMAEAKVYQGFTKITSPLSGVVTEKKIEVGSMAVPGAPMFTVENTSAYNVEINVDEGLSGRIRPGMPVDVELASTGQKIKGNIKEIVPSVDPASRTFLVKISVHSPGLRSGMYAKVVIPNGSKDAIVVPEKAVVEKGQLTGVYAVDEKGVLTYRLVRPGKKHENGIEILSGLGPKERIITEGVEKAVDGGVVSGVKAR